MAKRREYLCIKRYLLILDSLLKKYGRAMSLFRFEAKIYGAWQLDSLNVLALCCGHQERYKSRNVEQKIGFVKLKPDTKFKRGKQDAKLNSYRG